VHLEKPRGPTQTCRVRISYRITCEGVGVTYVRKTFSNRLSRLFRKLPECAANTRWSDKYSKQLEMTATISLKNANSDCMESGVSAAQEMTDSTLDHVRAYCLCYTALSISRCFHIGDVWSDVMRLGVANNGIKRNFVSGPREERCHSSNKSSQNRKAQSNRLCIRGTVRSENPMPSRWNDPKMPKGEFRTQTRLQLLAGNQSVLGGISSVARCSPLNCKFGCLIHGQWVKCHSAPWASAFTSNAQEEANSRLQPEIRHQESGFRHQ